MRQLVTIRTVSELLPIEGADRIELAKVDGWQCVVKKGEFKVGDNGFYFEIDSMLPMSDERFVFLAKGKTQPFARVKTIRLKGQLSQGLLLPMSMLTEDEAEDLAMSTGVGEYTREVDLAAFFGVQKYEPPVPIGGKQKGTFPTHLVPKTDQERIQNIVEVLDGRNAGEFEITEKLDGTSCTFFCHIAEGEVLGDQLRTGACSRNWEMQILDENVYARIFNELGMHDKLRGLGGRQIAVQGEIIGPSIQGNKYKLDKPTFFVFDIYDIDARGYLNPDERQALTQELGLNHVPVLNIEMPFILQGVLDAADGRSQLHDTAREGLVFKSYQDGVSFKAISNKWLLKNE